MDKNADEKKFGHLFNDFSKIVLMHPNQSIPALYSRFLELAPEEQKSFIIKYALLFVKSAEAAQQAPESVRKAILAC